MRLLSEASLVEGGGDIFVEEPMLDFHDGGGLESVRTDAAMWIWTIALALDEWYKYAQEPSTFQADFWNKYDYLTLCMTFGSLTTRLFSLTLSVEILAFSVLLIWCRLFKYLQLSQTIGLLVIMIMEMFNDIALWVLVSIIFIGAFTTAFVAISDPTHIEKLVAVGTDMGPQPQPEANAKASIRMKIGTANVLTPGRGWSEKKPKGKFGLQLPGRSGSGPRRWLEREQRPRSWPCQALGLLCAPPPPQLKSFLRGTHAR